MIDFNFEKIFPLTSMERYNIIHAALDAANDNGFLDKFVFERALWTQIFVKLVDDIDMSEEDLQNPIIAWDKLIQEYGELIDQTIQLNTDFFEYIAQDAGEAYSNYSAYLLSIGGAFNQTDMLSSSNLETFTQQLQDFMNSDNTLKTLQVADDWGMNNTVAEEKETPQFELVEDSLVQ